MTTNGSRYGFDLGKMPILVRNVLILNVDLRRIWAFAQMRWLSHKKPHSVQAFSATCRRKRGARADSG